MRLREPLKNIAHVEQNALVPLMVRFGVAGVLNTAFGYIAFVILVFTGLPLSLALIGATAAGIIFNFQTSRRLVFGRAGNCMRFALIYLVILGLNWVALRLLQTQGVGSLYGQALLLLPIALLSFFAQKRFVFELP